MIKNIVFDLMDVILEIAYDKKALDASIDEEEFEFFKNQVLQHQMWQEMRRGLYSLEEGKEIFKEIFPAHEDTIETLLDGDFSKVISIHKDILFLVESLKDRGYQVFLMGNLLQEQALFLDGIDEFISAFHGTMFSYEVKLISSEIQMYEQFLKNFHLDKEETIFIISPSTDLVVKEMAHMKEINLSQIDFLELALE